MSTVKQLLREKIGMSADMSRYYVKGYFESIGETINYKVGMELNGNSEKVLKYILSKSKDESIINKVKGELDGTNHESVNERIANVNPLNQTNGITNHESKLANELAEANERIAQLKELNDQSIIENERITNQFKELQKQSQERISNLNGSIHNLSQKIKDIEAGAQALKTRWSRDIGNYILSAPNVKFLFLVTLVSAQAYLFALLEERVLDQVQIEIAIWAAFLVGVLFEASGFMIARQFESAGKYESFSIRDLWLVIFFLFQCVTNNCLFEPWNAETLAEGIGREIISLATPVGLLAYSFLYFKE